MLVRSHYIPLLRATGRGKVGNCPRCFDKLMFTWDFGKIYIPKLTRFLFQLAWTHDSH